MKWKFDILFLLMVLCCSCTEVIDDFSLNTADERIVVDATISPDKAIVILSKTTSYLDATEIPYLSGAQVTISFNDKIVTLTEDSVGHYSKTMDFPTATNYELVVTIGDEHVSARTYMPEPVLWDSASVAVSQYAELIPNKDTTKVLYEVFAYMTDPKSEANYYRVETFINDTLDATETTDDVFFNGQSVQLLTMLYFFDKDDTLTVSMKSIDKAAYEFFNTLALSNSSSAMFSAPDNPKSNLQGNALGRFYAYSIDTLMFTFK